MSWHGIGLISGNYTPLPDMRQLVGALPRLSPGSDWNGTAGTGFTLDSPVPTDPARTTAKPAVQLLTPPNQFFTDTLDVGVMAMASENGTLINNFGIDRVEFHFEGNVVTVAQGRWLTRQTPRGPRTYFGWWVRLKKPASTTGTGQLYIRAVARDATMQDRVIGPFLFCPRTQLYTHQVTIAPSQSEVTGERYQTIDAATKWLNQQASINPLITITEAGHYDMIGNAVSSTGYTNLLKNTLPGYFNITASVPGVVIGRTTYTTDGEAYIGECRHRLHLFGANLAMDWRYQIQIKGDTVDVGPGTGSWLDGIHCYNTAPDGAQELWRGVSSPRGSLVQGAAYITDCLVEDIGAVANGMLLVLGNTIRRTWFDTFNQVGCAMFNLVDGNDANKSLEEYPAFTVQYTGSEATATLTRTGGHLESGLWTLAIGATNHTFNTGPGSALSSQNELYWNGTLGDGYFISDLVDWLNTIPDVTATLLIDESDPFFKRHTATLIPAGGSGGFGVQDIKTTLRTFYSTFKHHADWTQHATGALRNVIMAFNDAKNVHFQTIFLSVIDASPVEDMFIVGNAFGYDMTPVPNSSWDKNQIISQIGRGTGATFRHLVVMHNTMSNQAILFRMTNLTIDARCVFANLAVGGFTTDNGLPLPNATVEDIHVQMGGPATWTGSLLINGNNMFRRGTRDTLFVDRVNDVTPSELMRDVGFAPRIPFDLRRTSFPAIAAPGAIAAPALALYDESASIAPSATPLADLIALLNATGGLSAVHDYANATISGGNFTSLDMTANGNNHTQGAGGLPSAVTGAGAVFTGSNQTISQPISSLASLTVVLQFTKDLASTDGVLISDNANTQYSRYTNNVGWIASSNGARRALVNGTQIIPAADLTTAFNANQPASYVLQGINPQNRTALTIGRAEGGSLLGTVRWGIVLDELALGASYPQALALARQVAEPQSAAPEITSSTISGTAQNGRVLTANATFTGFPAPTIAYQWQRNGTNISGQTEQTIALDAAAMGLVQSDVISCAITVTNNQGSAVAQPSATFTVPLTQQLATASATLAVYDWTDPASMTRQGGGPVVQGSNHQIAFVPNVKTPGTLNLAALNLASAPVYNNGAIHDGINDVIRVTFAANTGPNNATLVWVVKSTDNDLCLAGTNSTSFFAGLGSDGSAAAPHTGTGFTSSTYFVNGAAISPATRDTVRDAWCTGAAVIARTVGTNFQNASVTDIRNSIGVSSAYITGNCMLIAVLDRGASDYAGALALAEQEAARVITALGL